MARQRMVRYWRPGDADRAQRRNLTRNQANRALKAERLFLGISRREQDRRRHEARMKQIAASA